MTEIKLYNTKTRSKEDFAPIDPDNVRMYVCGPTVYDRAHIGNARPVVVFDVLFRLLRHVYGEEHVTYVRNFTDVDDKINAKAAETGRDIRDITDETIGWYHEDMKALGARLPTKEPRATDYIDQMKVMIQSLIDKRNAYEAEGHVLFDVNSYDAYGDLSGRKLADMRAGARVEITDYKRDPMDFVLWKPSTGDQPGWESPWGFGRPGWHIECSAMSLDLLGESFDIHGGGLDLQFPHHENEIAQSCCANPSGEFANYWLHNEMLQVEGKKMSKSLGNFFTVRDLLEGSASITEGKLTGNEIRMALLLSHYRNTMDFGVKRRHEAKIKVKKWTELIGQLCSEVTVDLEPTQPFIEVVEALSNDLNTRAAIDFLEPKKLKESLGKGWRERAGEILASQILLGFDLRQNSNTIKATIKATIARSNFDEGMKQYDILLSWANLLDEARSIKDFGKADQIKQRLVNAGFEVRIEATGAKVMATSRANFAQLEALK